MKQFFERLSLLLWNSLFGRRRVPEFTPGLMVGFRVVDEAITSSKLAIPSQRRAMHLALLGRTGTGKSSLLRWFCEQDIRSRRGFLVFDIHGELTPALLSTIAAEERRLKSDLSEQVIVVGPADAEFSVGMNPLEIGSSPSLFVRVLQFAEVLKQRWGLASFGARTDELLRNALYLLAANGLTLVELAVVLTDATFRTACLVNVKNAEVRQYFELRYDAASEAMQAVMREPVLNKVSTFTADEHFRHVIGQASTFSLTQAMDDGKWILLNTPKSQLGVEALTLCALFLTSAKQAAYERDKRGLFTIYADELQNLVGYGADLETMLAELRKFGVSLCTANQYLEQLPQELRAALLQIGTHIFFQLSSPDAQFAAQALDGGKPLAERLKNLAPRHLVVKSGSEPLAEVLVPELRGPSDGWRDLYERSRRRWARPRQIIEAEIATRQRRTDATKRTVRDVWE
jgi:hypothetical protein